MSRRSNYDKYPATKIAGEVLRGWNSILEKLSGELAPNQTLAVELYTGVYEDEVEEALKKQFGDVLNTRSLMKPEKEIVQMTEEFMTDDVLFGYVTRLQLEDYFNSSSLKQARLHHPRVIMGSGATLVAPDDALIVYVDMARWETQMRFRRHEVKALGVDNLEDAPSIQYKRGYFNDWRILDRHKSQLMPLVSWWIDTHHAERPLMISGQTFLHGLQQTLHSPFRVVPFFDPAPWGGQWMKDVCDLDRSVANYGWCFDCVPEENSLYLSVQDELFELPSQDLLLYDSKTLLGEPVWARFGQDFPIRFDFLDTIGGGNLSLQVHPTNQFIRENFGMYYTQDESYYLLDATPEAYVYLGLREGINPDDMLHDLRAAQKGEIVFDADKYVNKIPAKKHDHFLIPGGTIHCSGAGSMVLEISSTPNIFTFKLWDWQRLGLDGKPRPINVERGSHVIQWNRTTPYVMQNLVNHVKTIDSGEGWIEEKTGLHPNEFIETRRHRFSVPVHHYTQNSVNVLNLLEGEEAIVESPTSAFAPFVVHYAETFIIPASIGHYTIRPYRDTKECVTIKASVRI